MAFDVLGKLEFEGRPLRELLLDAIRYGEQQEVRAPGNRGRRRPVKRTCAEACGMLPMMSFRTGQRSYEPAGEVSLDDAVPL